MNTPSKKSMFSSLLDPLTGGDLLRREKARLEAFLAAVPGEYCGFAADGSVAYSAGFKALIGAQNITNIHDIQNALSTSDAAVLEGQYFKMVDGGGAFQITVTTHDNARILRLSGSNGAALDGGDRFHILWAEDVSDSARTLITLQQNVDAAQIESRLRQMTLDTLPIPLWQRGGDGALQWCNHAYAALMDITPAQAVAQQKDLPCTPKDKTLDHLTLSRKALETRQTQGGNFHAIIGGKRVLLHKKETPLPTLSATVGLALDQTHEEQSSAELLRYQSAHKQLLEQLRTAIAIFTPDQKLEFYNSAFAGLWGLQDSWLNCKPKLGDILEKLRETRKLPEQADFKKYKQGWIDMFTRLIDPQEDMMYLPDGSALRHMAMPHPMGGLMVTFEDVTSRLELESSYNTLIAVQKETLDHLAEGVAAFGGDGRLRLCNPSFVRLWGLNPEDVDGTHHISKLATRMVAVCPPEDVIRLQDTLISHALQRASQEGRLSRGDGLFLDYATMPLPDGGVLVSYSDVTDKAKVESALREKNAALEAAEALKTDFLANVSYQLRTPLSSIMGFAEILGQEMFGPLNPKQKEYAGDISMAGERLVGLIDDILDLSTIEAGYMTLDIAPIDTAKMLENVANLTRDWAHKKKLQFMLETSPAPLVGDERRMKQVLINLIRNAINFTPEGGLITLTCRVAPNGTEICVADTGIGIPAQNLHKIFEPFERGTAAKDSNGERGAGLGLTIVKSIVEMHGGTIGVQSAEGSGTSFTLCFSKNS